MSKHDTVIGYIEYLDSSGSVQERIRVQGLPYGTYLVVETTVPKDLYQAEPYLVVIDRNSPMSAMATPKGSVLTASDSYQKFTVLDEQIEVYLRITKLDEETGKPVLLPGTAFQIYYLDDDGNYLMENGTPKLVRMTDTVNGHLTKNVTTFYTNAEGVLTLPEKLPLGKYRIVESTAPNGFYNEWLDAESHYVDFTITTDRIYQATGDKNENGMDTLVIGEKYSNHETLGKLTIRKTGEVLTGWQSEPDGIDPWMTGEAESGSFTYETRPLAGAEYTITAAEDIYTQDRQLDNYGNRTLWYAKGDVVAVVTTGDGAADTAVFAPARTAATYDFLSVIHDGTIGEVSVTLPLGSYHIAETQPPYGYAGTDAAFDVTLAWDNQMQEIVVADTVEFHNEREKAKVGIYKTDLESGKYLAGAVFNLYTADDIYDADGSLVFAAGELVATSPETSADGTTYFDCDIPIRGEKYGSSTHKDAATNSGKYIVKEIRAPLGYYVNEEPMEVTFTYDGQANYYLKNDFEKHYTDYGCPFIQADCDALAPSDNLIIYGHNMKDGSMFADLAKYRSKDFWQAHKTVWFDTALGSCAYEIFAVIHTTVQANAADAFAFYLFVDAAAPEEFADYVSACKARALYDTGISAEYGDMLLTLSTCDNITDDGRLLVIAKQTETE